MDEEGEEDGEAEAWVRVVGGVGDEAFGEFVQGYGDGGLEADGEEGILGDVVVMQVGGCGCGVGSVRVRRWEGFSRAAGMVTLAMLAFTILAELEAASFWRGTLMRLAAGWDVRDEVARAAWEG